MGWNWIKWSKMVIFCLSKMEVTCQNDGQDSYKLRPCTGPKVYLSPPGVALNFFLEGWVPRGFQNVGSRERIFLKKWGSWERKFGKIWVERARILARIWLKKQKISKHWKQGAQERHIDGKFWAREQRPAWKKGVMTAALPHTPFQCECPPGLSPPWILLFIFYLFYSTGKRHKNENKTKTWGLLSCWWAQKAQKSTITGRCSAPNSAELDKLLYLYYIIKLTLWVD